MNTFTDKPNFYDFILNYNGELLIRKNEVYFQNQLIAKLVTK